MFIPVRCFSCGKVIANKYEKYLELLQSGKTIYEALNTLGLTRYCCRQILMTYVDNTDTFMKYQIKKNC